MESLQTAQGIPMRTSRLTSPPSSPRSEDAHNSFIPPSTLTTNTPSAHRPRPPEASTIFIKESTTLEHVAPRPGGSTWLLTTTDRGSGDSRTISFRVDNRHSPSAVAPCTPHPYLRPMSSEAVSAAPSPTALQADLQQFDADYIAAFDAGNAQALAELFTEDAIVMNTFGSIVSGRSAIMAALEHSFAGPSQGATLQITPQHPRASRMTSSSNKAQAGPP